MHRTEHEVGAARAQCDETDEQAQQQQDQILAVKPQIQGKAEVDGHAYHHRNGQADAGQRRTQGQVQTGLQSVGQGRAHRRHRLGRKYQHGDDQANHGMGQTGAEHLGLDRGREHLGQADDGHQRQQQAEQTDPGIATARDMAVGMCLARPFKIEKIVAVPHRLPKDEDAPKHQRGHRREHQLRHRVLATGRTCGEARQHQRERRQRHQNGQGRPGGFRVKGLHVVSQAADEQAQADHPAGDDEHGGIDGVAGERGGLGGIGGQHHRHDERHLDDGHGQREHQRAEGLAHPMRHHLRMMHRGDHRPDECERAEQQHEGLAGLRQRQRKHAKAHEGQRHEQPFDPGDRCR